MSEKITDSTETLPIELVNQVGLATVARISRQRIGQLKEEGRLPAPYGLVNGEQMVWTRDQAEQFAAEYTLHVEALRSGFSEV